MNIFERRVGRRRYLIASQSVWDPERRQPYGRQAVLGSADPSPIVDLAQTRKIGTRRVGDIGALLWVADELDAVNLIDRACGGRSPRRGPSVGEYVLAVAAQRVCVPGAKRDLAPFLESCIPRVSCLPAKAFSGQDFARIAASVGVEVLDRAQIELARAAVQRFQLSASVLAFDTTNFDTHISTTTPGELARRGHAKSKRGDLRVVGLGVLASETGHVPLFHRTYPGNGSDQSVLVGCLQSLRELHDALGDADGRGTRAHRTLVRDGGSWGEQLELDLRDVGYHTLISLPLGHSAAEAALAHAALRGRMKRLRGPLAHVRAARLHTKVGDLDRTLVVVESQELLRGQKRGIAVALRKAKERLGKLAKRATAGRIGREALSAKVAEALAREHLSHFVVATVTGGGKRVRLSWHVDTAARRRLERTRLGRRVLCTDRHSWGTERIVRNFRGQWQIEEIFRRTKKGCVVPWGPSYQRTDSSIRLHTFATVFGLMLVSLTKLVLGGKESTRATMRKLAGIDATMVRTATGAAGRRPTLVIPPKLDRQQAQAVSTFGLDRWLPCLRSSRPVNGGNRSGEAAEGPSSGHQMRRTG